MRVWAVVSQKGGVGKSTLAVHLAAEGAAQGLKTLLLDLDPQGNANAWGERRGELPPDIMAQSPAVLTKTLAAAEEQGYELVIFDTAPHANQTALQAAKAADFVLIPCRPSQFDLEAIAATLDLCDLAKRPASVVINAAPIRSRVVTEAAEAIKARGADLCPVIVRERVAFRHCIPNGATAGEFEPNGAAAQEIGQLFNFALGRKHSHTSRLSSVDSSTQ